MPERIEPLWTMLELMVNEIDLKSFLGVTVSGRDSYQGVMVRVG